MADDVHNISNIYTYNNIKFEHFEFQTHTRKYYTFALRCFAHYFYIKSKMINANGNSDNTQYTHSNIVNQSIVDDRNK